MTYPFKQIEEKWRKKWEESGLYSTPKDITHENKYYILPQLPYPSGSGLHVGHSFVFIACDIMARFKRMNGSKVLQVMGWDSFGLPAENYAIKNNVHPKKSTNDAIENFRYQCKLLGLSVDWDSEVGSHNPDYYKWTQWFFKLFYERGLVYRKNQAANWCDSCKTVLANDQVTTENTCERCSTEIIQKMMDQWFVRITDYADRLYDDLDKVDWPTETVKRQRDWIGRSEGAEIEFGLTNSDNKLTIFTTRPDTIFGVTFMALAPEHPLVQELLPTLENQNEIEKYILDTSKKTDLDRQIEKDKTGVELKGVKAVNPVSGKEIPIFIADYVLMGYGTGAIMAVPAHDERDFEFAKKFGIDAINVIMPNDLNAIKITNVHPTFSSKTIDGETFEQKEERWKNVEFELIKVGKRCYLGEGSIVNSDFLNDLSIDDAKSKIISHLESKSIGRAKKIFKLRDWCVSRQRFWGAPIPIVYDPEGKPHILETEDLPVLLPDDVDFKPTGQSPLTYSDDFQKGVEEKFGKGWKREVDTLDTFMCSSWYFFRYLDPKNDEAFASQESLKTWMPVDFYIGGAEHVNGHLLFARFFTKVLFDAGIINFDEPFTLHKHQGMILGEDNRKMSKRWGNVINPTDIVEKYGADTMRMYEMFMGPLEQTKAWNDSATQGVHRFIRRVYDIALKFLDKQEGELSKSTHKLIKRLIEQTQNIRYNTAISDFMKYINEIEKDIDMFNKSDFEAFVLLLAPYAPYIAEEIWEMLGNTTSVHLETWPTFDPSKVIDDVVTYAVQVNGKLRGTFEASIESSNEELISMAKNIETVQKYIGSGTKKEIVVPGKLVSFVI